MEQFEQIILCIEDNKDTCELVEAMFGQEGYKVIACSTADKGLLCARRDDFAAIILDNWLENASGEEVCQEIRKFDELTPVIFFTAEARPNEKQKALEAGADAYLVKPNDLEILTGTVIGFIQKKIGNNVKRTNKLRKLRRTYGVGSKIPRLLKHYSARCVKQAKI